MALLQEIQVPLLAVNDTTLTVVEIHSGNGSPVKKGDTVMVFETSKTTYDVEAESDGYIQYLCEVDNDYEVNTVVARIYSEAAEASAVPAGVKTPVASVVNIAPATGMAMGADTLKYNGAAFAAKDGARIAGAPEADLTGLGFALPAQPAGSWQGETLFSNDATRAMAAAGVDPSIFRGWDLVTARDVQALLHQPVSAPAARTNISNGQTPASKPTLPVDLARVVVQKLSGAKKREIEYLTDVQAPGLTSTINTYIETEGLFTHINRSLQYLKDALLPVIVYEASRLLKSYPTLNAYYTGEQIAVYKDVHPGFAIDIDKGLKVLKIAGAGEIGMVAIEQSILELSGKYLDDKLDIEDLTDITFTITDLSSEGVAFFRPLVNKMNSAILGVSAIDTKLQRCTLSLTFDHRVAEGKLVAQFLRELKERLESYRVIDRKAAANALSCFKCYKTLEEDLSGVGFTRVVTPEGQDGFICQSCLKGF